jgi:cell division transport system permease protein
MNRLAYFVRRAVRGMRQAVFVNAVAVLTIAIALFVVAVFAGVVGQVRGLLSAWGEDVVVSVYIRDGLEIEERVAIESALFESAGVDATIVLVTKEEALDRLRTSLGDDADILEGLDRNPLPASFEIRGGVARGGPVALEAFAETAGAIAGVTEVDYGREWVGRLEGLVDLVALAALVLGGLILIAATVTVSNTIKLAVFARRDEIEIMKLCGATDAFVRAPFLIEGVLQGLFGALIAGGGAAALWFTVLPRIEAGLADAFAVQVRMVAPIEAMLWLILAGTFLGLAGSALSLGRFLKV